MLDSKAFESNRDIESPNRNIAPLSSEINESKKDLSIEKIKYVMENKHLEYKNFKVPLLVDYGFGSNWGDAH